MNKSITPVRLRIILSIVLLLLASLGVGVFIYGYKQLKAHAADAQAVAFNAMTSRNSLQDLVTTKKFLDENASSVTRADQLVAQSQLYKYQDQIINDINKYATEAGLKITNISFDDAKIAGTATPAAAAIATTAAPAPPGVKSTTASITIANPTDYTAMLKFIHLVEQSLFRMQISKISLSQSSDQADTTKVTSDALSIEVYIR